MPAFLTPVSLQWLDFRVPEVYTPSLFIEPETAVQLFPQPFFDSDEGLELGGWEVSDSAARSDGSSPPLRGLAMQRLVSGTYQVDITAVLNPSGSVFDVLIGGTSAGGFIAAGSNPAVVVHGVRDQYIQLVLSDVGDHGLVVGNLSVARVGA